MLLYIDPGTGSMLFTILVGLLGASFFAAKKLIIKFKFLLSGGKSAKTDTKRIPFVIFSDSKRYWNIFESICDEFEKREKSLVYMTASPDDPALTKDYQYVKCQFIGEGNKAFVKLNMLKADVLLSTTPGLDVYQWKRSRDVKYYVHVIHAASDVSGYRMFGLDYYDAVLLSGDYQSKQIRQLETLRKLPAKELKVVGVTYMDELAKKIKCSSKQQEEHRTTVLLAPSWGSSSIFNRFGDKIIDALLSTGYKIVVRPHPQSYVSEIELMKKFEAKYPNSENLEWNRDNDNFNVLNTSDILISDFSGVTFDFSLVFDKPIIYTDTVYDKSPYDAAWLEDDMWMFNTLPMIGTKLTEDNLPNIKELIDNCLNDNKFADGRERARNEGWQNRGNATIDTVDYLIAKYEELNSAETKLSNKQ